MADEKSCSSCSGLVLSSRGLATPHKTRQSISGVGFSQTQKSPLIESSVCEVTKPAKIEICGADMSLDSLIEEFAGIWEVSEWNRVHYRQCWKEFLPQYVVDERGLRKLVNSNWCITFNPIVAVRKCFPQNASSCRMSELPYFLVILNFSRDERPRDNISSSEPKVAQKDPLQKNLIDRDMIIAEFGNFYLTPNGFPYHRYSSLLVSKDSNRRQVCPSPIDIETWMRFSILTKQYVFYNSEHAGASIPSRMHAQLVDPAGIRCEDEEVLYPILNERIVQRTSVRDGVEILKGYGIEALVLRGRDAPHRAALAVKKIREEQGHWYNILVNQKEVFIIPRNAEKETSFCIGKKVGAYEISGVILVGNIFERLLEKIKLDPCVNGAEIFSHLSYEQIASNISHATTSLGGLEHNL